MDAREFTVSISGFLPSTVINLDFNDIRELTEDSFRPLLEVLSQGDGHIFLIGEITCCNVARCRTSHSIPPVLCVTGNPVMCDCSMAWVAVNPDFLADVQGRCTDGTDFQNLDPNIFLDFCIKRDSPLAGDYSTWINSEIPAIKRH